MFIVGTLITLTVGGVLSQFASDKPDGLESVATRQGFADSATESATSGSPLAGYGSGWTRTLAGIVGVAAAGGLGYALLRTISRPDAECD